MFAAATTISTTTTVLMIILVTTITLHEIKSLSLNQYGVSENGGP